ncbi:MAG: GWxTD domain-containing protein [candidate division Zixibacteria bacterium]|nr:GWxTD domain-containing protein [candidate division Zixibacteria bacterium]MBU1472146.1 GWxTD domain-containing protein [candidate division Zixibacteria bacterium]MBU2625659.1 GWxTD domain-containing protein [candidate division Zixibacteria bacterium]
MRIVLSFLLCMLALQTASFGQAEAQQERIAAWLDYACFKFEPNDSLTLVEFYYGLQRYQLTFASTDSNYAATAFVWIEILDEDGSTLDTLYKKITTSVKSPAETNNRNVRLTDQIATSLRPGTYIASLYIEDVESHVENVALSGKYGQRKVKVLVPSFNTDRLTMSGIELAYRIDLLPQGVQTSEYKSIDKSQRRVIPNPSRIFVNEDSMMYFYSEAYNLVFGRDVNKELHVTCKILDSYGATVSHFGQRRQIKPGTVAIVSSALDIHDMAEGNYALSLEVDDGENGATASATKPFQLLVGGRELSPGVPAEMFTGEDAAYLERVLKYVLTSNQKATLKELSLEGKMRFFEEFWIRSDPDPSTRLNEFKVELFRRYNYSNEHYSIGIANKQDGWETDRGRVYIVYGEPDEIEYYPSTSDLNPFEKWNYYSLGTQGNRYFIFEDETGYGDYRLAHSDAKGEPIDPVWQDRIEQGALNNY